MLITQAAVLSAMITASKNIGTRGGSMVQESNISKDKIFDYKTDRNCAFDDKIITTVKNGEKIENSIKDVRPVPEVDLWFENIWNEYNERWNIK